MIVDLVKDFNQDCSFTDKINEGPYTESVSHKVDHKVDHKVTSRPKGAMKYHNFVACIVSEYDPMYSSISSSDKKMYLKQKVISICSEIEELQESNYDSYNYKPNIMKISLIQFGLQVWEKKDNYISSLYYLNDYYKRHFVIVHDKVSYETSMKNYEKVYLSFMKGRVSLSDLPMTELAELPVANLSDLYDIIPLQNDIKKSVKQIYKLHLEKISQYKMEDLKVLAQECNIDLKKGGKAKLKQVLYDEINVFKLNTPLQ